MKKTNNLLKILLVMAVLIAAINIPTFTKAEYHADKQLQAVKPGDVIYFDSTGLSDWDNVYIYLWKGNSSEYISAWPGIEMSKVAGTDNLYSYTVPSDVDSDKYNMLIFNCNKSGDQNQTIDLGFIEKGFVYKVDSFKGSKRIGYWYLYDKSSIASHFENVKKYQADKQYYTTTSYGDLDNLITKAATELEDEIRLEEEKNANGNQTGKYYIQIDFTMDEIDTIVNNLVVNKDILEQKINDIEGKKDEFNSKYTPSSMKNLNSKVDEAKELLSKDSISVDEMKKILSDIADSINSLTEKSNKTELEKLLKDVENLDKSTYTDDTVKKLENVYQGSKDVNANDDATQTEVDNSVRSLKEAIEALKKKENDNKENNNNDNDNKEDNNKEDNNMEDEKQEENNNNEEKNNTNNKQEQTSVVENKKNDNNVNAPKTGDMYIIIYGSLLVIAIITFIVTIVYNKRKNKQK
ncbi:MAG TPA: starch-binding protein [Clostridiaceae bacterium]|jgi:hypothetical protein|nr:starch-binding protein [Clostridiaceae bacterium]